MSEYILSMKERRQITVTADKMVDNEKWIKFYKNMPQGGGPQEVFRVATAEVESMETKL